jgi:integrase
MTEKEYVNVFEKKLNGNVASEIRKKCSEKLHRSEEIFNDMRTFNRQRFKELFKDANYHVKDDNPDIPKTFEIKTLFEYYIKHRDTIKIRTKIQMRTSLNVLETYYKGATVFDVTPKFCERFEKHKTQDGCRIPTISSYLRDLRTVINYFKLEVKILPRDYDYPFGRGGYSIKNVHTKKQVLSEEEIRKVVTYDDFDNDYQRYSRDIWLTLYYSNGINFIDLVRLRKKNVVGNHIHLFRMKTERTRKTNIQEIIIPLTKPLKDVLNRVTDPTSDFVLGQIQEGYTEQSLINRKEKITKRINSELKKISEKLDLSVPLNTSKARDCYASSLKRKGVSRDQISEMLGHSNPMVTGHYLDSLNIDESFGINEKLVC